MILDNWCSHILQADFDSSTPQDFMNRVKRILAELIVQSKINPQYHIEAEDFLEDQEDDCDTAVYV